MKAICRKEDISTAKCIRKYVLQNTIGVHRGFTLARFQDTASAYYYVSPKPYQPGCNQPYPEDDEWEVTFVLHERRRPGSGDLKWKALVRDGFYCRGCAVAVKYALGRVPSQTEAAIIRRAQSGFSAGLKAMEFLKYDTMVRGPRPPKALPFLHPLIYPTGLVSHGTKPHRQAFTSSGGGIGWFRRRAPTI